MHIVLSYSQLVRNSERHSGSIYWCTTEAQASAIIHAHCESIRLIARWPTLSHSGSIYIYWCTTEAQASAIIHAHCESIRRIARWPTLSHSGSIYWCTTEAQASAIIHAHCESIRLIARWPTLSQASGGPHHGFLPNDPMHSYRAAAQLISSNVSIYAS